MNVFQRNKGWSLNFPKRQYAYNYTYTCNYTNLCNYEDITTQEEIPAEGEMDGKPTSITYMYIVLMLIIMTHSRVLIT